MMFAEQLPIDPPTAGRPRLLDLCCGEQGAGVGYSRAGFDVTGVDLSERAARRAPLPFILGDAVAYLAAHGHEYDAVHVSPPCPAYSVATPATHRDRHPRLIEPLRELLVALGKPYVIENVVGAPLLDPVMLCGSMFGVEALDDDGTRIRLERHRLFESNVAISAPGPCAHDKSVRVAGLYGGWVGGSDEPSGARRVHAVGCGASPLGGDAVDEFGGGWAVDPARVCGAFGAAVVGVVPRVDVGNPVV